MSRASVLRLGFSLESLCSTPRESYCAPPQFSLTELVWDRAQHPLCFTAPKRLACAAKLRTTGFCVLPGPAFLDLTFHIELWTLRCCWSKNHFGNPSCASLGSRRAGWQHHGQRTLHPSYWKSGIEFNYWSRIHVGFDIRSTWV